MSLEKVLLKEINRSYAYIDKELPFTYIKKIHKEYGTKRYSLMYWYNRSLDIYNWMLKNNVYHDAKHLALYRTAEQIIKDSYSCE